MLVLNKLLCKKSKKKIYIVTNYFFYLFNPKKMSNFATRNIKYYHIKMKENIEEKNVEIADVISKTEGFIQENQKKIVIVIVAIVAIIGGYFALQNFYFEPREKAAAEEMFAAQQWFDQDSLQLSLDGNAKYMGFKAIIDEYGSTKSGRLAEYYAGIASLRLGKYEEAINYLSAYNGKDTFTKVLAVIATGDAEMELGNTHKAISLYEKAAKMEDNIVTTPYALFKAAFAYQMEGNNEAAAKLYKEIKKNYPQSTEYRTIDKYIAYAEESTK